MVLKDRKVNEDKYDDDIRAIQLFNKSKYNTKYICISNTFSSFIKQV